MTKKDLDLNGLVMEDIDFEGVLPKAIKRLDRIEKECKEQYGNDWFEHYVKITSSDYMIDSLEKIANHAIFYGTKPFANSDPQGLIEIDKRYYEKLRRLFGPFYKRHIKHEPNNPKVNRLLIKDALNTGKWKELPEQLHVEYHKIAGDVHV